MDDLRCCLADFGLSIFAESQAPSDSSRMRNGCIRWLASEYMDSKPFNRSYLTARDVYAYGCTVIEVGPASHHHRTLIHSSYQIFTGKPPFSKIKNDFVLMSKVARKKRLPRPPSNIFPNDRLCKLVRACLSTRPGRRPNVTKISKVLAQLQKTPGPALNRAGMDQRINVYGRPNFKSPRPLLTDVPHAKRIRVRKLVAKIRAKTVAVRQANPGTSGQSGWFGPHPQQDQRTPNYAHRGQNVVLADTATVLRYVCRFASP